MNFDTNVLYNGYERYKYVRVLQSFVRFCERDGGTAGSWRKSRGIRQRMIKTLAWKRQELRATREARLLGCRIVTYVISYKTCAMGSVDRLSDISEI